MIEPFVHRTAQVRLVLRNGAAAAIGDELRQLGIRKPLLLCGVRARRSGLYARIEQALRGFELAVIDDIPEHSSVQRVESVAAAALARGTDGLIALGGGSASDSAKAVALLMAEGGQLREHAVRFTPPAGLVAPPLLKAKLPIVAVPCTASGAEVNSGLGIRDSDGRKLLFTDLQLVSRVVLIDPEANVEVPAPVMCATGMNGLAHGLEGLYSNERTPLAESLALEAIVRFGRALPRVHANPLDVGARAELLYAGHLGGLVMLNAKTALHHAICHAIGSVTGVSHGAANAVLLPHSMAFNAPATGEAQARASAALGEEPSAAGLLRAIERLCAATLVPTRLRDIGVPRDALEQIALKTMGERGLHYNPQPVRSAEEVLAILQAAW